MFRCHPGLACFNSCCRNKRLTLLPYDVLRLSRALGRSSGSLSNGHQAIRRAGSAAVISADAG